MTEQAAPFDPGPPDAPAPAPERTGEEWWAAYLAHRRKTITGAVGMDISPEAEERARRRFARRHGLGPGWLARYGRYGRNGGMP